MKWMIIASLMFFSVAVEAEEDDLLEVTQRFLKAKPLIENEGKEALDVIDAWERIDGLSVMLTLNYDGRLPSKWKSELVKRVVRVRRVRAAGDASLEIERLASIVKLYAAFADFYLMGKIEYSQYAYVSDFALSQGRWLAEKVRGFPYLEKKCRWSDDNCASPPRVWEQ